MTIKEYKEAVERTECSYYEARGYMRNSMNCDMALLHGAMGVSTESGELLDTLKKHIFYGKDLDVPNIKEEVGDVLWYLTIIARSCGFTIEDAMEANVRKLKVRYPEKFTTENALNRDTVKEMQAVDGGAQ